MSEDHKISVNVGAASTASALIAAAIYLGLGALVHAAFVGEQFVLESTYSWGAVLGGPLAVAAAIGAVAGIIAVVFVAGVTMIEEVGIMRRRRRSTIR